MLRKPGFIGFLLDFPGHMSGSDDTAGNVQVKKAMRALLDRDAVSPYLLQASHFVIALVIAFDDGIINKRK